MNHSSLSSRLLAAAMLAGLAACGGSDSNPATPAPASTGTPTVPTSSAAPLTVDLALSGAQEVPPNASAATGIGNFTLDPASRQFTITVTASGMASTAAHIHNGATGVAGPILFPMTEAPAGSGRWTASGQLTSEQDAALRAGQYYVNVHSAAFPNGEIRAQIVPPAPGVPVPSLVPGEGSGRDGY